MRACGACSRGRDAHPRKVSINVPSERRRRSLSGATLPRTGCTAGGRASPTACPAPARRTDQNCRACGSRCGRCASTGPPYKSACVGESSRKTLALDWSASACGAQRRRGARLGRARARRGDAAALCAVVPRRRQTWCEFAHTASKNAARAARSRAYVLTFKGLLCSQHWYQIPMLATTTVGLAEQQSAAAWIGKPSRSTLPRSLGTVHCSGV